MTKKIYPDSFESAIQPATRKPRVLSAAMSGAIFGALAAVLSSFINTFLFPDIPLRLDFMAIGVSLALWILVSALLAGIAAYSSEGWTTILASSFLTAAVILIYNFVQSSTNLFLNLLILLGLSLPFTALMIPVAYIFYWLATRFVEASRLNGWGRGKIILVNLLTLAAMGASVGWYARLSSNEQRALRIIQNNLEEGKLAASPDEYPTALKKTEEYTEHKEQEYTMEYAQSVYSTVGIDVKVKYADGYVISCTVVLYPGSEPAISPCKGEKE